MAIIAAIQVGTRPRRSPVEGRYGALHLLGTEY